MIVKGTENILNLKQFLHRQQVLKLYRTTLKTIRKVSDQDNQRYLLEWTKKDFKDKKGLTDPYMIKSQMKYAETLLTELQQSLELSHC